MENTVKKKILVVAPQSPENPNGGARVMRDRFIELSQKYDIRMLIKHNKAHIAEHISYAKVEHVIQKTTPKNPIVFLWRYIFLSTWILYRTIFKEQIKVVQIEFIDALIYAFALLPLRLFGVRIYYSAHDVQSLYYDPTSLRYRVTRLIEQISFTYIIDKVFVWGSDDAQVLISWGVPNNKIETVHPIIDTKVTREWRGGRSHEYVFMGSIAHAPNRDAIQYILKELWPEILRIEPDSKLHLIIGADKNITDLIGDAKQVICHGFVEDVNDIFAKCRMLLAPIFSGTGIKIKNVESFAMGIPVLTTPLGVRDFDDLDNRYVLVGENKDGLIYHIQKVLAGGVDLAEISRYEKAYYNKNFTRKNAALYDRFYV